jgi:hypothetical protein
MTGLKQSTDSSDMGNGIYHLPPDPSRWERSGLAIHKLPEGFTAQQVKDNYARKGVLPGQTEWIVYEISAAAENVRIITARFNLPGEVVLIVSNSMLYLQRGSVKEDPSTRELIAAQDLLISFGSLSYLVPKKSRDGRSAEPQEVPVTDDIGKLLLTQAKVMGIEGVLEERIV